MDPLEEYVMKGARAPVDITFQVRRNIMAREMITTGKRAFAVCHKVCRGQNIGHTAKARFAVCQEKRLTANIWHTANAHFAVCLETQPTANNWHTTKIEFAVCFFFVHTAKIFQKN